MNREREMTTFSFDTETAAETPSAAEMEPLSSNDNEESVDGLSCCPEKKKRKEWKNSLEFILSCVAMSVGLGNLWRFPFTAYENGGGAFLLPYLIVLMVIGRPMALLELALGQFSSSGHIKIWKMNPLFKGVGYSATIVTFLVTTNYCVVSAQSFWYFLLSFQSTLPWMECNSHWTDVECDSSGNGTAWIISNISADGNNTSNFNLTDEYNGNNTLNFNLTEDYNGNSTSDFMVTMKETTIPAIYVKRTVLKWIDSMVDGIGLPDFKLAMCLLFFWFIVFGSRIKDVESLGKIAYFTALFPYVALSIFLVVGLQLPGAWDGVSYFIKPQFDKLWLPKTWFKAIEQCFYSLSVGFGPVIMQASHNPFRYNVYNAALVLGAVDTFTSLLAGVTVFAVLGHLKADLNATTGGPSLVFEVYPLLISKLPWYPHFFGALFFLMLFTLGLGSTIADTGSIITVIQDQFPKVKKIFITAGVCVTLFFCSLIYITPIGEWVYRLVDDYACALVIVFTTALEIIGIAWVYGLSNVVRDIEFMIPGQKIGMFWKICWGLVIPVGLSIILFETLSNVQEPTVGGKAFPPLAIGIGWCMFGLGLLVFPICAIHTIVTRRSIGLRKKIEQSVEPSLSHGPLLREFYTEWKKLPPPTPYKTVLLNFMARCKTALRNYRARNSSGQQSHS